MTAPITGPFTLNRDSLYPPYPSIGNSRVSGRVSRKWYRQRKDKWGKFDLPLSFSSYRTSSSITVGATIGSPLARTFDQSFCWISTPTTSSTNAHTKAYAKFDEQMRGQAAWGVTLLQYRQTYDSLVNNITDLYRVFRDIKRLNFGALHKRFKPPKGFKATGKRFADRVLEWRFGWQPLWEDIHVAAKALGRDLETDQLDPIIGIGSGFSTETSKYTNSGVYAEVVETRTSKVMQVCKLTADIRITNPNALLWESVGMTNPALVAYEMIPFSFVLNYFINLEEYLKGLSPFMGMTVSNPCTTLLTRARTALRGDLIRMSYPYPNPGSYRVEFTGMQMQRTPGPISGPKLRIRDPWILQPGRGTNCVALLLQQLAKQR